MRNVAVAAVAVFVLLTMSLWARPGSDERRGWIQIGGDDEAVIQGSFRIADAGDQHGSSVNAIVFSPFICGENEVRIQLASELDWHAVRTTAIESDDGRITGEVEPTTVRPVARCAGQ